MTTNDLLHKTFTAGYDTKPNKKQKHYSFLKTTKGIYWKQSPDQEWADTAKASYLRISKRAV